MRVEVVLGQSWKPTLFRSACNDPNYFQLCKHFSRWSYDGSFPLLRSQAEPALSDLFSDGQAFKNWPSAIHDHMSISFNIPLTRWRLLSELLYKHFAGFSPSVLLPTNEPESIFSRACRQSRLIMRRGFRVRRAHAGLAPGVTLFTEPGQVICDLIVAAVLRRFVLPVVAAKVACSATCSHWILRQCWSLAKCFILHRWPVPSHTELLLCYTISGVCVGVCVCVRWIDKYRLATCVRNPCLVATNFNTPAIISPLAKVTLVWTPGTRYI